LIGLPDPLSQPTHHRSSSSSAFSSRSSPSPSNSVFHIPSNASRAAHGVPIPRPTPQSHRPVIIPSAVNTPLSHSPSSSDSPFPFSPVTSLNPASYLSNDTQGTTPPSSSSIASNLGPYGTAVSRGLTYPSAPPPSLSSSFGSPSVAYHMPHRDRDASLSPIEPLSRRNSNAQSRGGAGARVAETGSLRALSSRRGSIDRGGRVAESGTLIQRSRASSQSLPPTDEVATETDGSGDSGNTERFCSSEKT